jgi:hypothetical protein
MITATGTITGTRPDTIGTNYRLVIIVDHLSPNDLREGDKVIIVKEETKG